MDHCQYPKEVSLFSKPCNDIAYQKMQYVDYKPVTLLSGEGPVTFTIPGTGSQYINLKKSYLQLKLKIVNGDGSDITEENTKVAPINFVLHSIFNQVDVQLQQQLVSTGQNYGYKAYMETVLEYGRGAKNTQLEAQCFYKDLASSMDGVGPITPRSLPENGMVVRYVLFEKSKPNVLIGPLMADICQQDRVILNGVEIQIKLWPSKDPFRLETTGIENPDFKIQIMDATFKVCKVTPTPALLLGHANALRENNALYPYQKTQVKTFNISGGQYDFLLDDLYQGQVPSRLVVAMVTSKAYNGDYERNPYNIQNFKLSNLGVYINDESMPGKPMQQMQWDLNESVGWTVPYYSMFTGLDRDGQDWDNDIRLEEYPSGYCFFVFDLLPGDQPALSKANVKIEGAFKEALAENITVLVYAKFPAMIEITEARSVLISNS